MHDGRRIIDMPEPQGMTELVGNELLGRRVTRSEGG